MSDIPTLTTQIEHKLVYYPVQIPTPDQALDFIQNKYPQSGKSFRKTATECGYDVTNLWITIAESKYLKDLYEHARTIKMLTSAEDMAEETVEISDTDDRAAVARNRIQARQWLASRYDRDTYGDKVQVDQRNINVEILLPIANPNIVNNKE